MKLRPIWLPYSKTFAGSPLSTDKKAKSPSMAPKTPYDLTSSYLPSLPYYHTWKSHTATGYSSLPGHSGLFAVFCAFVHTVTSMQMAFPQPPLCKSLLSSKAQVNILLSTKAAWKAPIQAFANGVDPASPHIAVALCLDPRFSTRGDFAPPGASGNVWRHF